MMGFGQSVVGKSQEQVAHNPRTGQKVVAPS